jgi:hypothetical protein
MPASNAIRTALLVLLAALLYYWAIAFGVHRLPAAEPEWWPMPGTGADALHAAYAWLQLRHAAGLLLVSAPFAIAIALVRPKHPVRIALLVALIGIVGPNLYLHASLPAWQQPTGVRLASAAMDYVKFLVTLPLLTWLAARGVRRWRPSAPGALRDPA